MLGLMEQGDGGRSKLGPSFPGVSLLAPPPFPSLWLLYFLPHNSRELQGHGAPPLPAPFQSLSSTITLAWPATSGGCSLLTALDLDGGR